MVNANYFKFKICKIYIIFTGKGKPIASTDFLNLCIAHFYMMSFRFKQVHTGTLFFDPTFSSQALEHLCEKLLFNS